MKKVVYAEERKKENFLVKTHRESAIKENFCSHFWYIQHFIRKFPVGKAGN